MEGVGPGDAFCNLPVRNQEFADDIAIESSHDDPAVVFSCLTTGLTCLDKWFGDIWPSLECIEDTDNEA